MILLKILYAAMGIAVGIGILKYRKIVYSWTGRFYWAEKYLGSGGTMIVITLVGLGLIFVSIIYPFGVLDRVLQNPTSQSSTSPQQDTNTTE